MSITPPKRWSWSDLYQTKGTQIKSLVTGMAGTVAQDGKRITVRTSRDGKPCITENLHERIINMPDLPLGASDTEVSIARRTGYIMAQSAKEGIKSWQLEEDSVTKNIASLLDGGRIRNNICDQYRGDRWLFGAEASDIAEQLASRKPDEILTTMLALSGVTSVDMDSYSAMAEVAAHNPKVAELWDKADKAGLISEAMDIQTDDDSWALARKVKQFLEEEDAQESFGEGQGDSSGDSGEGNGDDGEGAGDAGNKPGDGETQPFDHLLRTEMPFIENHDPEAGRTAFEMEAQFKDYVALGRQGHHVTGNSIIKAAGNSEGLANQLRTVLQVRSQAHYVKNQRRGKLARSQVYKVCVPQVGNGDWNTQVFRKKVVADCLDTAVYLLVDCSGSMSGSKYIAACAGAKLMAECLDTLNMNYEVLGFSTERGSGYKEHAVFAIFKQFGVPNNPNVMLHGMDDMGHNLNNNPDGPAVRFAVDRLMQQRNKRKLLIVLSDGSPATSELDDCGALKDAVEYGYSCGVEMYGIGIKSDAVRAYYKEHVVLRNPEGGNLEATILDVLSNKLA